jgi:predicted membrane-bound mannosyltransferase
VVLFGEEWPILLLGAVGAFATFRCPTLLRLFLIWAFVLSLAVYSWAGEKFAWLVIHPLLPLTLLAGVGVQAIWEARHAWYGKVAAGVAVLALCYTVYASYLVTAVHGADPRELLVSTQSSTEVKQVADEVLALAKKRGKLKVTIDSAEGATFPYAWYFRDLDVGYVDLSQTGSPPPESDVIILTQGSNTRLANTLTGYDGRQFPFRVWWVRDYGEMSPGNWARWMISRKPWNPTGGMPEWLYVRRVAAAEAGG